MTDAEVLEYIECLRIKIMQFNFVNGNAICRSEFESPEVDGEILLRDPAPELRVGDMVRVRIVAAEEYDLIGEQIR